VSFSPTRFGDYVLTAHLGRGGMADVYRAQRTGAAGFERTCVVKRILRSYCDDQSFVSMFINEAKIAAKLTHPNIAQVYDLGEVDGEYFIALEYVRGQDLLHLLKWLAKSSPDKRSLPPEVAAYVAREVCRGLAHAHEHTDEYGRALPIVHRDISPQNIMLGYDGQVKLVDFGIAKAVFSIGEETRSGALKGKIAYMSPEQVAGTNPGPESDVFAAGVVLYEMLVGRRLFKGANDFDTLERVKKMTIPPPSHVASWVPHELDRVVMHALERDRAQRYKRASSMARDLDEYLSTVRFSVEHMADYLKVVLPPEARQEIPDGGSAGQRLESASSSRVSQLRPPGATSPGTPSARSRASSSPSKAGGRRTLIAASLLAIAVGVGGAIVAFRPLSSRLEPAAQPIEPAPVAEAPVDLATPLAALPVEPAVAAPAHPAPAPAELPAPPPAAADRGSHHGSSKHTTANGRRPKIEILDDGETQKPKIETFED
jgi:serine/threonine-protein kinase